MKPFKILLCILLITSCWLAPASAVNFRVFYGLAGGTAGDMDRHNNGTCTAAGTPWNCCTGSGTGTCDPADNDIALAVENVAGTITGYMYHYDGDSTQAESSPYYIRPDNYSSGGVWHLIDSFSITPSSNPKTIWRDVDASDLDDNVYVDVNCTDTGSGTEDCDYKIYVQIAGAATQVLHIDADGEVEISKTIDIATGGTYQINDTDVVTATKTGVTNGDSHDHSGGDGAQIDHTTAANIGTNTHAQIDTHIASTANPHTVTAAQASAEPDNSNDFDPDRIAGDTNDDNLLDVSVVGANTVYLSATGAGATTSGAYLIGTYDEFGNSASVNVQDVLDDLDAEISNKAPTASPTFTGTVTIPDGGNIRGKTLGTGTAVDDDDCTGDQGKYWFDSVDNQWEFCNANSGTPVAISAAGGGDLLAANNLSDLANAATALGNLGLTATASEINTPLDGASVTLTEFQELENIDATTISAVQWGVLGALTGPTAARTYTLPDSNATILYSGGALGTPSGGTLTNATGLVIERTECAYIEDPVSETFYSIMANKTSKAWTLTEIWGESDQTVNFDFQVDDGTPADVNGTDISPAAGEAEDTSLSGDTELAAGEELDLVITSVSGTPTWFSTCITYTTTN